MLKILIFDFFFFKPKFLESLETERLRSMPNGFLPPSVNQTDGMIVLGDAMNMRHPLTGGKLVDMCCQLESNMLVVL